MRFWIFFRPILSLKGNIGGSVLISSMSNRNQYHINLYSTDPRKGHKTVFLSLFLISLPPDSKSVSRYHKLKYTCDVILLLKV